jgi:hypothetical protein
MRRTKTLEDPNPRVRPVPLPELDSGIATSLGVHLAAALEPRSTTALHAGFRRRCRSSDPGPLDDLPSSATTRSEQVKR